MRKIKRTSFEGVYWIKIGKKRLLATINSIPGFKSCDEDLIRVGKTEYRIWDPYRSKAAAYLHRNAKIFPIRPNSKVLYLGVASGTTASYLSDIVGGNGVIFGVDFAPITLLPLLRLSRKRRNIIPIFGDARKPWEYAGLVSCVDVIYCDVAQPNPSQIVAENARLFLRSQGHVLLAVKASSIDVSKGPKSIFREEKQRLMEAGFEILDSTNLEPFHKKHSMFILRYPRESSKAQ